VAIDIDSTLYDFETPFRQACFDLAFDKEEKDKETYFKAAYHSWVQWRSPADIDDRIFTEALAIVHSDDVIKSRPSFEGAVRVCNHISDEHEIIYLTNRNETCTDATDVWLKGQGFPVGTLICTMEDKAQFLRECQFIIDDRPRTLVNFVTDFKWQREMEFWNMYGWNEYANRAPRKGFSLMYDYNDNLTDCDNIYLAPTWGGIAHYLHKTGVLSGVDEEDVSCVRSRKEY